MTTFDCSEGEGIVIDGRIRIEVAEIGDEEVCLKIHMPDDVLLTLREELDVAT